LRVFKRGRKIGLALGGGAARGLAHIGVLKVLEEARIMAHFVAGTSVGSLIGSLYCAGVGWERIKEVAQEIDWRDLVSPTWPGLGLVKSTKLEKTLNRIVGEKTFEQLSIPFRAVAVDIESGDEVVLDSGPVAKAVRASCSIPGIFEPTELHGRLLVDGGLVNNLPVDVVKAMGAEVVIGVDLSADRLVHKRPENVVEVFYRSLNILIGINARRARGVADVMVTPRLGGFSYHDLGRLDQLVAEGERAMREQLDTVIRLIR